MKLGNCVYNILRGEISKTTLVRKILPITICLFILFLALARAFYPYIEEYPYNWTTSMVSRLGWPHENTIGWIFFAFAYSIIGIFLIMIAPYVYRRFSKLQKFRARVITLCLLISGIGSLGIALIPNYPPQIFKTFHGINALLIFMGIFISAICSARLMEKTNEKTPIFSRELLILFISVLVYVFFTAVMMALSKGSIQDRYYFHDPRTPLLLSRPFWEWQAMFGGIGLIGLLCLIIPDNIE